MARAERSTKAQAQAYRFGLRRLEDAVQYGTSIRRPLSAPRHGMSVGIGAVIAAVLVAGFLAYGALRPAPSIKDAAVIIDKDNGATYVVRQGTAYPAMNLASAKLAAQGEPNADKVRTVSAATLAQVAKGQLLGIPGAPQHLPTAKTLLEPTWTVCDAIQPDPGAAPGRAAPLKTTAIIGRPKPVAPAVTPAPTMLVTLDGSSYFVIHDGVRSRVSVSDSVLKLALGLSRDQARRVSLGVLNMIPEGEPMAAITFAQGGRPVMVGPQRMAVGDVVRAQRPTGDQYFALVSGGWQEVSPVVAEAIQAQSGSRADIPNVAVTDLPGQVSAELSVAGYPTQRPTDGTQKPVLCVDYRRAGDVVQRSLSTAAVLPLPQGAKPVPVPPRKSTPATGMVDEVYLTPGSGLAVTQSLDGITDSGALFLITDEGVRFPVVDRAALSSLGLDNTKPAVAEVISLLPMGPTLDPAAARVFFGDQSGS